MDYRKNEEEFVETMKWLQRTIIDDLKEGCDSEETFIAKCHLLSSMYDYMGNLLVYESEK